ncbi:MAG: AAA family ATPase [Calditrichia bacterium]
MSTEFYSGNAKQRPEKPANLPVIDINKRNHPAGYLPDPGLVDAVNVALTLGQPLLLTGEPGTGKTQLAYSMAWELGLKMPLKFETKSTSVAKDLFYTFDTVGRFYAAQTGEGSKNPLDYIRFNALGTALIRASDDAIAAKFLPAAQRGMPQRSIVLIDEIDKAPRDFPNDILNEIEGMYFKIPEAGNLQIAPGPTHRPVVILTSNSEKHLPDAFLRRCAFYHIPFPDETRLQQIVRSRLGQYAADTAPMINDALALFKRLRDPGSGLRKKPATAELLGWLAALKVAAPNENPFRSNPEAVLKTLSSLVKTADDQKSVSAMVREWLGTLR